MRDENGDRIIRFAPNQALPEGWRVIRTDSGHYIGTDGELDTIATVNRFHARRWVIHLSQNMDNDLNNI